MTRRLVAALGLGCAVGLAATPAPAMVESLGEGEGQVSIVAWPGYIERGETDKAYDWVTGFEQATGCKVSVKTAGTSDEMVALMNEGGFDLVTASGDASLRLIAGKQVQPINTDFVPSWSTIDERLQNAPDGQSNKGRVQAFDGPIYIADAALYLMHHKPELGIKDPYELNEDQYKAALELLRGQRQLVGRYCHDAMVQIDDFS